MPKMDILGFLYKTVYKCKPLLLKIKGNLEDVKTYFIYLSNE
jgi:hypothetical protein